MNPALFLEKLKKSPVVGIARGIKEEHIIPLMNSLKKTDLIFFEITLNTPNAFELIKMAKHASEGIITVGAGTVISAADAIKAIESGAEFLVSPVHKKEISMICQQNKVAYLPGAMTPTEVLKAYEEGGTIIKVFPSSLMGVKLIKELRGPFKEIPLLACGGVNSENIEDYFQAGVNGVAFGSSILNENTYSNYKFVQESIDNLLTRFITI